MIYFENASSYMTHPCNVSENRTYSHSLFMSVVATYMERPM